MVKKRGRKSVGDLTTTPEYPPFVLAPALRPPDTLAPDELAVWHETVPPLPRAWFTPEQIPLIESYCVHVAMARRLRALLRNLTTDDVHTLAALVELAGKESARALRFATALRLTVQSRAHAVTRAGARPRPFRFGIFARYWS